MEQRSLRVLDTNKTFFSKLTSTITKMLIPTKVSINGMMISIKRNNLIKAYSNYEVAVKEDDIDKKDSLFKKYEEGDISAIKEYLQSTQEGNLKDALLTIGIKNNKEGIEELFKNLQEEEMLSREQNEKSDG